MTTPNPKQARWNERYATRELVWSAGPNALLEQEVTGMPSGTALDAACGEGRNALWLAEQGWSVTAVDFSQVAIDKAMRIAERRGVQVDWRVLDLAREPLPKRSWDLVCVLYLHTDPEERALWLPKLARAVAPGGTFVYVGHDPSNIEHGVGGPQNPALLPDADSIASTLRGFRIDAARVVERPVDADPGHGRDLAGIALDTFVRAFRH
ncbi:MAG TPA: class I SAM-dependent methyltransferase [Pseudomonadales bacterium]